VMSWMTRVTLSLRPGRPRMMRPKLLPGSLWGTLTEHCNNEVQLVLLSHGDPLPMGNGTSFDSLESQSYDMQGGCRYYRENSGMDPYIHTPIQIQLFGGDFEFCPLLKGVVVPATAYPTPAPSGATLGTPAPTPPRRQGRRRVVPFPFYFP
jgi:hypothetical protein